MFLSLRIRDLPATTTSVLHAELTPAPVSPRTWGSFSTCAALAGFFWLTTGVLSTAILSPSLACLSITSSQLLPPVALR